MGFMSKVRKKGKDEDGEKGTEEPPVSDLLDPETDDVPVGPESDDVLDEAGLLAQYTDAPAAVPDATKGLPEKAPDPPPPLPSPAEPVGDVAEDLMDIFAAEEEEDVTIVALADNLDEIDPHALLAHAIDVQKELQEFARGEWS
jgi:hypothetical protein